MGELGTAGKLLVTVGGALILVGGLLWLLSKLGFLGHLPGDIRIQRSGFTCLIPLVSSIILSILLTVVLSIVVQIVKLLIHRGPR